MDGLETVIAAGAGAGVVVPTLALLTAFVLARFHFGGYVRRMHPDVWNALVREGTRTDPFSGTIYFDATPELAEFRVASDDDLGDRELAARRKLANRAERFVIVAFLGGGVWILLSVLAIVSLKIY